MRALWPAVVAAAAVVLVGCGSPAAAERPSDLASTQAAAAAPSAVMPPTDAQSGAADGPGAAGARIATTDLNPAPIGVESSPVAASPPVRVSVASVGIDASLVQLGLGADGAVAAPENFDTAGWYTGSAQPGQTGPAVLAGHVDSRSGPAAFHRLAEVAIGDDVAVHREDGSVLTFRVTGIEQYAKDVVPTQALYGPTPGPQLRLITCGGDFDRAVGHYEDNVVVYATI